MTRGTKRMCLRNWGAGWRGSESVKTRNEEKSWKIGHCSGMGKAGR